MPFFKIIVRREIVSEAEFVVEAEDRKLLEDREVRDVLDEYAEGYLDDWTIVDGEGSEIDNIREISAADMKRRGYKVEKEHHFRWDPDEEVPVVEVPDPRQLQLPTLKR